MMTTLEVARKLEAIAQTGLHFAQDSYDRERYEQVREIAAFLLSNLSALPAQEIIEWSKTEFGYATPKVDVRAFILREGRVLLARENADGGRWTLPGGWADVNETPSESVAREVEEETGYQVRVLRLLGVFDRERQGHAPPFPYHVYKLFFLCEIVGGAAKATSESAESRFFARDELPELSVSRVLPGQLERFFRMIDAGDLATRFD